MGVGLGIEDRSTLPVRESWTSSIYAGLGAFVARHWLLVTLTWVVLAYVAVRMAPRWDDVVDEGNLEYLPETSLSVQGERLLAKAFPAQRGKSQIAVVLSRAEGPLEREDLQAVEWLAERLRSAEELPLVNLYTRRNELLGKMLTSPATDEGQATLILMQLPLEFMDTGNIGVLRTVQDVLERARREGRIPAGLEVGVSGSAAIGGDTLTAAKESIRNIELTTVVLVLAILLVVYRAPLLSLVPMATIALSVIVSQGMVTWLTQANQAPGLEWLDFKTFKATRIFIIVVLYGTGTDYCLFLISRYREELAKGLTPDRAVVQAMHRVGGAVVGSALTTSLGLAMMFFAEFGKFSHTGSAIALCLVVATLACVTLAPALLVGGGRWIFWPRMPRAARAEGPSAARWEERGGMAERFWQGLAARVVSRPGLIFVACAAVLLPLAYEAFPVEISYDLTNDLGRDRPSVRGTALLRRHFGQGDIGPVTVLAEHPSADLGTREGEEIIAELTEHLYEAPDVAAVRSLTEPLGDPPGPISLFSATGRRRLAARKHPRARATYLSQADDLAGKVTRLDVVLEHDPFSPQAVAALEGLRQRLASLANNPQSTWHGGRFEFAGTTAGVLDLKRITERDQVRVESLVVAGVLLVMVVILRRVWVSLFLICTVAFSYFVTIGATELLFRQVYAETYHGLDWKVPIFVFVILVSAGVDYNIYLATRVFEEQRTRGLLGGLREGLVRTGGIITSCGIITAGSFLAMATGTLRAMVELGFALTLGILLDALLIRPILVPALLAWVYRRRQVKEDHQRAEPASEPAAAGR